MSTADVETVATWWRLARVHARIARELDLALVDERDLSWGWFQVLDALQRHRGRLRVGELADEVTTPVSSLSRRLDRLEELGYLRRDRRADDARAVVVILTPDGRQVWRGGATTVRRVLRTRFGRPLDARRTVQLGALLAVLDPPPPTN